MMRSPVWVAVTSSPFGIAMVAAVVGSSSLMLASKFVIFSGGMREPLAPESASMLIVWGVACAGVGRVGGPVVLPAAFLFNLLNDTYSSWLRGRLPYFGASLGACLEPMGFPLVALHW